MPEPGDKYAGQGFILWRELPDGRLLALLPRLFDGGLITLGPGGADYDGGFTDGWEFEHLGDAYLQALMWNPAEVPEPIGWERHIPSMRRQSELGWAEVERREDEARKNDPARARERQYSYSPYTNPHDDPK